MVFERTSTVTYLTVNVTVRSKECLRSEKKPTDRSTTAVQCNATRTRDGRTAAPKTARASRKSYVAAVTHAPTTTTIIPVETPNGTAPTRALRRRSFLKDVPGRVVGHGRYLPLDLMRYFLHVNHRQRRRTRRNTKRTRARPETAGTSCTDYGPPLRSQNRMARRGRPCSRATETRSRVVTWRARRHPRARPGRVVYDCVQRRRPEDRANGTLAQGLA